MLYDLSNLIGLPVNLYHTTLLNTIQLNDLLFEAIEDESDGYRSAMDRVNVSTSTNPHPELLGVVNVKEVDDGYFKGFEIVDTHDNHVWAKFGTDNYDDWYPCFTFEFIPKIK
jgi:hypothetical protein